MLCHKCPHQKEIERLQSICCSCCEKHGDKLPGAGGDRRVVSLDAMVNPEGLVGGLYERLDKAPPRADDDPLTTLPPDVEERLRGEIAAFLRLSFVNQILLLWVLRGESLAEFGRLDWLPAAGREFGQITRQAANERVATICKTCPGIARAVRDMVKINAGNRNRSKPRERGALTANGES